MEIVGSPVGSLLYCKSLVKETLHDMLKKSKDLALLHPQSATKLLANCIAPAPSYISQVCHPNITKELFNEFDDKIWHTWTCILGGIGGDQLELCPTGLDRSRRWAYLPTRYGGTGLRSWSSISDYSWFCSFASCSARSDPNFQAGRVRARAECEAAFHIALKALGGVTYVNHACLELLPPEEADVLWQSDYYKDWVLDHKSKQLQHEFNDFIAKKEFKALTSTTALNNPHVTVSEKIRCLQAKENPEASLLPQLFRANLSDPEARLTKMEFIISARQFLCLPPLKIPNAESSELKCGCQMQLCPNPRCENALLDAFGNHALTCHPGIGSRKATLLEKSIERVYRKAGGRVERQPSTFRLLGEMFSKDDLMALFPGKMTVPEAKKNSELALELVDALTMVPSVKKDAIVEEIRTRIEIAAESKAEEKKEEEDDEKEKEGLSIIRFDLCLAGTTPYDAPKELWMDHAIVQETAQSYQADMLAHLQDGQETSRSPAFQRIEKMKERKYRPLLPIAKHLMRIRALDFQPFFLNPVISSLGYLNLDAENMVKWMQGTFNQALKSHGPREDGLPLGVVKHRYNFQIRNALCFGLLRGKALAMNSQGRAAVSRS
jgi:hypothetical protein